MSPKTTKSNLLAASTKIKILHAMLADAKSDIKSYKAKQKDKSPSYKFDWYALPLLKAELTKQAILQAIECIAYQGVEKCKKHFLNEVIRQATAPSRSTCPMTNLQEQERLAVNAMIYSKLDSVGWEY